ncbi:MAG: hypothetical protein FJX76_00145 [Armatimonadetes bacterium]|nr:hypothetical protein [Armatimonadota bacterium]
MSSFSALLEEVPPYDAYPRVEALHNAARWLAEQYPDHCALSEIGRSRQGTPILSLRVGDGPFQALVVGLPHPDEPIGSLMISFLAKRLLDDPEWRRDMSFTWHFVWAADPDGARLNEEWYHGPFDPGFVGRHYYRPVERDQFEWSFPLDYKLVSFTTPNPESAAVMRLIDGTPIDYLANLHNCTVGGAYLYLSHPAADLHAPFYEMLARARIPPHRGAPEVPYLMSFDGDAVFRAYGSRDVYDFYERVGHPDPGRFVTAGTCCDEYAIAKWDAFTLVCELPYFVHPDVAVRERAGGTRRALLADAWRRESEAVAWVEDFWKRCDARVSDNPFGRVLREYVGGYRQHREAELADAQATPATVAEEADVRVMRGYDHLFVLGQTARALAWELGVRPVGWQGGDPPRAGCEGLLAEANARYDALLASVQALSPIVTPTPGVLARGMLEMVLHGAVHARDKHRGGRPRGAQIASGKGWTA